MNPEILCPEAYHRDFAAKCELAREMLWGNGAVAIQMIISKELGLTTPRARGRAATWLTCSLSKWKTLCARWVEVISERGGALGAMDNMVQRGKIQDGSMVYSVFDQGRKKHDGSLPLIGVNTFLPKEHASEIATEIEPIRSTEEEKGQQVANVKRYGEARNALASVR